jgi:putative ABC transport system substrate-binding protein
LSHPGGNVTGVNLLTSETGSKRLGLLRELVPKAATIAVLINPKTPGVECHLPDVQSAARSLVCKSEWST